MPIVQLYLPGEHTDPQKKLLIEKVSETMAAGGCGPIDRIRIVIHELPGSLQKGGFFAPVLADPGAADRLPILNLFLIQGRPKEVTDALVDSLTTTLVDAGYERDSVYVAIREVPSSSWGMGNKTAREMGR